MFLNNQLRDIVSDFEMSKTAIILAKNYEIKRFCQTSLIETEVNVFFKS